MSNQNHVQTGRFYTAARKFQQLIGVTPAGEAIPGGPYTVTQFIVGIVVLVLGFLTRPLWSQGAITDVLFIAVAAVGAIYAVGKMPRSRRSIINLINCWITLMTRPRTGTYQGKKMPTTYSTVKRPKVRPTRAVSAQRSIVEDSSEETTTTPGTAPANEPAPQYMDLNSGLDRLNVRLTTTPENR